jgi:hypothetical protein
MKINQLSLLNIPLFNELLDRGAMLRLGIQIKTQRGWLTDSSGGTLYVLLVSVLTG